MTIKRKILWLCSWYPNRTNPLYGSFVRRQLKTVQPFCDIVVLFVTEQVQNKEIELDIFDDDGVRTHIAYVPKTSFLPYKLILFFYAYIKLYYKLPRHWRAVELVHLNIVYPASLFALFLYFFKRIPFIITEHSSIYRPERKLYKGFLFKKTTAWCFKKAKAVFALTDYNIQVMRDIRQLKNANYLVLPNVVDTTIFTPANKKNDMQSKKKFTFLHISGLHDSIKNISGILRSIARLSLVRQDFFFQFIGDLEECPPYYDLARKLNILDNFVRFSNEIPYSEVAKKMQEVDCFVLFSHVEGLPCVILEAMSTGLPVIATETGGIADWVTPETGILLDIGDEEGLVRAMNEMVDNRDKYDPSVIRAKIVDKCSIEAVGKAIMDVYEEVLA
ncbi:MAG: glycosyltransferase [Saprospiraceae bacterium]|nr:glycosyltransferase [Saprospiraceae bacterium]